MSKPVAVLISDIHFNINTLPRDLKLRKVKKRPKRKIKFNIDDIVIYKGSVWKVKSTRMTNWWTDECAYVINLTLPEQGYREGIYYADYAVFIKEAIPIDDLSPIERILWNV